MRRVVVVASSEIERGQLEGVLAADDELHVVVPAVEQSRLQWLANDEDDARAEAMRVGHDIADEAPADVADVDVKPDPPSQAVLDAIAEHKPDLVVVAVREGEEATWLEEGELDFASEIEGVPVTRLAL